MAPKKPTTVRARRGRIVEVGRYLELLRFIQQRYQDQTSVSSSELRVQLGRRFYVTPYDQRIMPVHVWERLRLHEVIATDRSRKPKAFVLTSRPAIRTLLAQTAAHRELHPLK
jgi:hypothetical protein